MLSCNPKLTMMSQTLYHIVTNALEMIRPLLQQLTVKYY